MRNLIASLLRYRPLMVVLLVAWIAGGIYMFLRLDIEAYPDPSPPLVEVITQNPSWSAEEMERQVTVPIETVLFGIPHLEFVRSAAIFGLSDVKLYFDYDSEYFWDRQEVLNRLQLVSLPANLSPQLSPESPVGEIYRYRLSGPEYSLNELKATQDWLVTREIKQVSGIVDVAGFGGSTRQYVAEVDARKLLQLNVTLPQVIAAVSASNANAGGNYLTMGSQSVNIRGVGLLQSVEDMQNVLIATRNGVPVYLKDIADVHEGSQPRLGQVGVNHDDDAVEGNRPSSARRAVASRAPPVERESEAAERRVAAAWNEAGNAVRSRGSHQDYDVNGSGYRDRGSYPGNAGSDYFSWRHSHFVDRRAHDSVLAFIRIFADGVLRPLRELDFHWSD